MLNTLENSIKMASFKISLNLLLISAFFFRLREGLRKTSFFFFFFLDYQKKRGKNEEKSFLSSLCVHVETLVECV